MLEESLTAKEQEGKVYILTFFSVFAKRMKLLQELPSWILHYYLKTAKTTMCLGKTYEILYLLEESLTAKEQKGEV